MNILCGMPISRPETIFQKCNSSRSGYPGQKAIFGTGIIGEWRIGALDRAYQNKAVHQILQISGRPFLRYPGQGRRASWAYSYYAVIGQFTSQLTLWYRSHASSINMKGGWYSAQEQGRRWTCTKKYSRLWGLLHENGCLAGGSMHIWGHAHVDGDERKRTHLLACQGDDVIKSVYRRDCFSSIKMRV